MNNSSIYTLMQSEAQYLGIDSQIFIMIAFICSVIVVSIFIYLRTRNIILVLVVENISTIIFAALGFIPIYIVALFVLVSLAQFWRYGYSGSDVIVYEESYADSLKRAYEAKFGYSNPAFNEEVDSHIKAVENLRKGYTRAVHRDKLKRLEKFVEVKWG